MSAEARPIVVVTGAGSGIGRATALHLDRRGWSVVAGLHGLDAAAALQSDASSRLLPLVVDVTAPDSVAASVAAVERHVAGQGLAGLVNAAGVAVFGPLEFVPLDVVRRQFEVNLVGSLASTQGFLPLLRRGGGRIVNLGSISGIVAPPFLGPYAVSKFALEGLSDSLRRELRPFGLQVSLVEAGRVATPIWGKAVDAFDRMRAELPREAEAFYGTTLDALRVGAGRGGGVTSQAVAEVIERALADPRPRARYVVGRDASHRRWLRWLPDAVQDWWLTRRLPRPSA